jgi:hypothetical protein
MRASFSHIDMPCIPNRNYRSSRASAAGAGHVSSSRILDKASGGCKPIGRRVDAMANTRARRSKVKQQLQDFFIFFFIFFESENSTLQAATLTPMMTYLHASSRGASAPSSATKIPLPAFDVATPANAAPPSAKSASLQAPPKLQTIRCARRVSITVQVLRLSAVPASVT